MPPFFKDLHGLAFLMTTPQVLGRDFLICSSSHLPWPLWILTTTTAIQQSTMAVHCQNSSKGS